MQLDISIYWLCAAIRQNCVISINDLMIIWLNYLEFLVFFIKVNIMLTKFDQLQEVIFSNSKTEAQMLWH